jgi:hypothetical protein
MQIFKLKKGGETENVKETIVVLYRDIDGELLKSAINLAAKNNPNNSDDVIEYLNNQFDNVSLCEDDVETFYY